MILHPEADLGQPAPPNALQVADVNGDGHADLVVTDSNLEIYLGDGKGGFAHSYRSPDADAGQLAPPADFNGDGKLDVAWTVLGVPTMRTGDGAGGLGATAWTPAVNVPSAFRTTADDFNGDGRADLAVAYFAMTAGGLRISFGQANGTFTDGLNYAFPDASATKPNVVDWGDVNHDGHDDLLLGTTNQGLMVAMGQANGAFADPAGTDSGDVLALYTDDFDGDGFVDDVVCAKDAALFQRSGSMAGLGAETPIGSLAVPVAGHIVSADLDDDGLLDVAATDFTNAVHVLYGNGSGFEDPESFPVKPQGSAQLLATGDVFQDGVDDLVLGETASPAST